MHLESYEGEWRKKSPRRIKKRLPGSRNTKRQYEKGEREGRRGRRGESYEREQEEKEEKEEKEKNEAKAFEEKVEK